MPAMQRFIFNDHEFAFHTTGVTPGGVIVNCAPSLVNDAEFQSALAMALELFPYWDKATYIAERATSQPLTAEMYDELMDVINDCPNREFAADLLSDVRHADAYRRRVEERHNEGGRIARDNHGYVYLAIGDRGFHKIGKAKQPKSRIKGLRKGGVVEYVCVIKCDNYSALEFELHEKFADKRVFGEWFNLEPSDVEYIKSLQGE